MSEQKPHPRFSSRFGFVLVTGALFVASFLGHWWLAWVVYEREQLQQQRPPEVSDFLTEVGRDTMENWQSEFLQLMWQVAGLAFLYHVGSPQSKDGNDRLEEKVDAVLRAIDKDGEATIARLDRAYQRD